MSELTIEDEAYMDALSKLTVVIQSRNRPEMLQNVVRYWARWPVAILVLDGSDNPQIMCASEDWKATITTYVDVSINARFEFASNNISTPFACLHADDDFLLVRSAASSVEWLEQNPEYGCVSGNVEMFFSSDASYLVPAPHGLHSAEARIRLLDHFSDYRFSYFYGVQRTLDLKAALSAVAIATSGPAYLNRPHGSGGGELGLEICGAALGKLQISDSTVLLKRIGNAPWPYESETSNAWLSGADSQAAVAEWRNALSEVLSLQLGATREAVDGWINDAMRAFVDREVSRELARPRIARMVSTFARKVRPAHEGIHVDDAGWVVRRFRLARMWGYVTLRGVFRSGGSIYSRQIGRVRPLERAELNPADFHDVELALTAERNWTS